MLAKSSSWLRKKLGQTTGAILIGNVINPLIHSIQNTLLKGTKIEGDISINERST